MTDEQLPSTEPTPASIASPVVPADTQSRTSISGILMGAVAVGLLLFLVKWAAPVLAPLSLGLFIAALTAPLFGWVLRKGGSPTMAMLVTIGVVLLVGAGILLLTWTAVSTANDALGQYAQGIQQRAPDLVETIHDLGLPDQLARLVTADQLVAVLSTALAAIMSVGGDLAFAVIIAVLLLLDGRRLSRLVEGGLGSGNPVFRAAPDVARAAVTYFSIRIRVNAVTAAGLLVVLLVLGVDDPLLWAICAFALSFVPYIGLAIALVPPTILAFAESGPVAALLVIAGGAVLNIVAENVLEPAWTGRALSLATWLVFLMFFLCVWLLGPVGMIVSMPLTVLIVLVLQREERSQWIARLLVRGSGTPPPTSG